MRSSSFLRSAAVLVAPRAPCASAASGAQLVNRILGRTNHAATCAKTFGELADKATGKARVYAFLGRAMVFLNRGEDKLAQLDVQNAATAAAGGDAKGLISSLRYQCAMRLLAEEQRKLTISGATTELQVAGKVEEVKKALDELVSVFGADNYAVQLALGEFYLTASNASEAAAHFEQALRILAKEQVGRVTAGTAAPEAVAAADVESSTTEVPTDFVSKNISTKPLVADKEAIAGLRNIFGDSNLSDAQLTLLGSVLAVETRGGPVVDSVNIHSDKYALWTSASAVNVSSRIAQTESEFVPYHATHLAKPSRAFYKDGVKMADVVKECPADKHIVDFIETKFGKAPRTAITADDKAFFDALASIREHAHAAVPAGAAEAASYYNDLSRNLLTQVVSRATVGLAEALTQLGDTHAAEQLLRNVEHADAYIDMWRLWLVKGNLYRKLGKIEEADAAFKKLHGLKLQPPHSDIPLMDEFRHKSAF
jgi:tetratricopeptide (TPR) repeat protein